METCLRGFSFMCEKPEPVDLHFIEEDALERTWKSSRRERKKRREEKIWDEFVKEKDIVSAVFKDDQYQFLDELPENCLKEMMNIELDKIKKEVEAEEEAKIALVASPQEPQTRSPLTISPSHSNLDEESPQHTCVVSFADIVDNIDSDNMFHIFNDEREELSDENVLLNDSNTSLPTVREREPHTSPVEQTDNQSNNTSSTGKSSENVTNVIESSIYCAKVKELRTKINAEILNMMATLDRRDVFSMEQEDMTRMIKRSAEFCNRFNRIYVYQLQRQMHDIKRNDSLNLPFAKHTQFQSQMVRIVSLHLNMLQSFQVFRKSAEQSWCVRESVAALGALIGAARAATAHCQAIKHPKNLSAATEIYNDDLLQSCNRLEEFVNEYTIRCEEFLNSYDNIPKKSPKSLKPKTKKRPIQPAWKTTSRNVSETETNLSMYSLDTLRLNTKPTGSTKSRGSSYLSNKKGAPKDEEENKEAKKSPRTVTKSRRPLMRDPQQGRPRAPRVRAPKDHDIPTMVETIRTSVSPDRNLQPLSIHKSSTPRTTRATNKEATASKKVLTTKLNYKINNSPKSPKTTDTANTVNSTTKISTDSSSVTPVCKIQCAIKSSTEETDKYMEEDEPKVKHPSGHHTPNRGSSPRMVKQIRFMKSHDIEIKREVEQNELSRTPDECEVSRLLKQLCGGDSSVAIDRISGIRNAQLIQISSSHSRTQPTTPQLLRILEETIQKKIPKSHYHRGAGHNAEKHRLTFNISDQITENMFQYRTKFVQHMLASPMYANCAVGKPWEMIGSVSEHIIDDVLVNCMKELQLNNFVHELVQRETS